MSFIAELTETLWLQYAKYVTKFVLSVLFSLGTTKIGKWIIIKIKILQSRWTFMY
jgi:hypothetical protein